MLVLHLDSPVRKQACRRLLRYSQRSDSFIFLLSTLLRLDSAGKNDSDELQLYWSGPLVVLEMPRAVESRWLTPFASLQYPCFHPADSSAARQTQAWATSRAHACVMSLTSVVSSAEWPLFPRLHAQRLVSPCCVPDHSVSRTPLILFATSLRQRL